MFRGKLHACNLVADSPTGHPFQFRRDSLAIDLLEPGRCLMQVESTGG